MNPVEEGPVTCVVVPNTDSGLARYEAFEMALEALRAPRGSFTARVSGSASLGLGMNTTVQKCLTMDPPVEKFWFIDNDHDFEPDTLMRLLAHNVAVVMAMTMRKHPPFHLVAHVGHRMTWSDEKSREVREYKNLARVGLKAVPADAPLVQVESVGKGGLLVDAGVFRAIPRPWFALGQIDPEEFQEDVWFSDRCRDAGIPLHVDTWTFTSHLSVVGVAPYRMPDGAVAVRIMFGNGKAIVFGETTNEAYKRS